MTIKLTGLNCPQCGYPLDVLFGQKVVKCNACGTSVQIKEDDNGMPAAFILDIKKKADVAFDEIEIFNLRYEKEEMTKKIAREEELRAKWKERKDLYGKPNTDRWNLLALLSILISIAGIYIYFVDGSILICSVGLVVFLSAMFNLTRIMEKHMRKLKEEERSLFDIPIEQLRTRIKEIDRELLDKGRSVVEKRRAI